MFKDVKLYPGGAREWDWGETGTAHAPGVCAADVDELLENGSKAVVLSRGMSGRLRIHPETIEKLEAHGVPAHVLDTEAAVRKYNELRELGPVGALIHSTC